MNNRTPGTTFLLNTLLVHVDSTDASNRVLRYGVDMALRTGARLVLVRVVRPLSSSDPDRNPETTRISERMVAASREGLRHIAALIRNETGCRVDVAHYSGRVAENILRAAYLHNADLVILGTAGRTDAAGRQVREVIRNSTLPVLVVGQQEGPVHHGHIIFPYNENPRTLEKAGQVMALAKAYRSDIFLLGCTMRRTAMARASLRLRGRRLKEQFRSAGIPARLFVVSGRKYDREILNYAARIRAGLIAVISGQPDSGAPDTAVTAESNIIRSAPVPVLAVPVA